LDQADDGDPIDVLLLMDTSPFPGCVIESWSISVIEGEQTEDEETKRNRKRNAVRRLLVFVVPAPVPQHRETNR
jgi:inorganic pyrophosphatase